MRLLGALCFLLQTMFYVAIVSYTPALVVNAGMMIFHDKKALFYVTRCSTPPSAG